MDQVEQLLEDIAELGKPLIVMGREHKGSNWQELSDNIRVYTSDSSDHTFFQIDTLGVGYFDYNEYELRTGDLQKLPEYIERLKAETQRLSLEVGKTTEQELKAIKARKVASLKRQLKELEEEK